MEMNAPEPQKSSNKWLIGIGIGCGGVVVMIIILIIAGIFFMKNLTQGFRDSEEMQKSLTAKFGRIEDYCPNPDGTISPERLRVFLSVREASAPVRRKLEASFEVLSRAKKGGEVEFKSSPNIFSMIKLGVGVVPQIAEFSKVRNQALLQSGMGTGEYYYIYVTAYFSWLKKPVDDGPGFRLIGPRQNRMDFNNQEAQEYQRDLAQRRVHRIILPMLQCQFAKLAPAAGGGKAADKWREALAAEIKAMEADRYRRPWENGLPEVLEAALKPFREQLEASYSRLTNPLEIAF